MFMSDITLDREGIAQKVCHVQTSFSKNKCATYFFKPHDRKDKVSEMFNRLH